MSHLSLNDTEPVNTSELAEARTVRDLPFSFRETAVRLFITCWLIYGLHLATNTVREIYLAVSIAEQLSFRVDDYGGLHPDLFETKGRGWHIGNNPGASMLGAIPYALLRPVTDRVVAYVNRQRAASGAAEPPAYKSPWPMAREFYKRAWQKGYDVKFGIAAIIMQVLVMAPVSAFGVVLVYVLLRKLCGSDRTALWLSLLYAFGTPIFFRTGFINQNLLVAHLTVAGFLLIWDPAGWERGSPSRWRWFLAGLAGGLTLLLDYTGVLPLLWLFAYGVIKSWPVATRRETVRSALLYIVGSVPPVLLLMFYQYQSFGHPLYPGQHWMPDQNQYATLGYRGLSTPEPALALAIAFDYRFGLFTSCPLLLLAFGSGLVNRRWLPRLEHLACWAFVLANLIFFSSVRYSWLQYNSGIRYLVPIIPFLFVMAAPVLLRLPRALVAVIAIASVFQAWSMAMYRDVERGAGLLEPILHVFLGGFQLPLLTVLSRIGQLEYFERGVSPLPLFTLTAALLYVIWSKKFRTARR